MSFFTFIKEGGSPPDRTPGPQCFFVKILKALMTFVSVSQFQAYLPWGQHPFSIVSTRRRDLLHDCEIFANLSLTFVGSPCTGPATAACPGTCHSQGAGRGINWIYVTRLIFNQTQSTCLLSVVLLAWASISRTTLASHSSQYSYLV